MKNLYPLFIVAFGLGIAQAQTGDRKLLASAGSVMQSSGYQLSFSLGEAIVLPTPNPTVPISM